MRIASAEGKLFPSRVGVRLRRRIVAWNGSMAKKSSKGKVKKPLATATDDNPKSATEQRAPLPAALNKTPGFERFGTRSVHPTLAFFLLAISAIFAMTNSLQLLGIDSFRLLGYLGSASLTQGRPVDFVVCSLLSVVFAVVILVGALAVLRRRAFLLGVVAAILAISTLGPCGVNVLLGLLALVLVMSSREQFDGPKQALVQGRPRARGDVGISSTVHDRVARGRARS